MRKKSKYNRRCPIYDGTDIIANCRISYNLDFFNGFCNCNPTRGKHKTIDILKDGRYAIIYSDTEYKKNIGKVVSDEEALHEILLSKNHKFLTHVKFSRLNEPYQKDKDKYDSKIKQLHKKIIKRKAKDEIILVFNDYNFLVGVWSSMPNVNIRSVLDYEMGNIEEVYNKIDLRGI